MPLVVPRHSQQTGEGIPESQGVRSTNANIEPENGYSINQMSPSHQQNRPRRGQQTHARPRNETASNPVIFRSNHTSERSHGSEGEQSDIESVEHDRVGRLQSVASGQSTSRQATGDDDVVFAGSRGFGHGAGGGLYMSNRLPVLRPPNHDIQQLNAALGAAYRTRQQEREEHRQRRLVFSPSPLPLDSPPPERRINLGGAVFQLGGTRQHYQRSRGSSDTLPFVTWAHNDISALQNTVLRDLLTMNDSEYTMPEAISTIERDSGGPANREANIEAILSKVPAPTYAPVPLGFARSFDMEEATAKEPIVIEEEGNVMPSKHQQPILICARCNEPLFISEAYRSPADRLYALRCGHLIDQRCLDDLVKPQMPSALKPPSILDVLDKPSEPLRKRRKTRGKRQETKLPHEYRWKCPVEGCSRQHVSKEMGGTWINSETEGAIAIFA
ncbi:uncharacterized protein L203_101337 [Cryptococcus depauperatus CBS 7841]|uniref:Uncharacterized protein n=1 Tax=Cryptococcus depauperatus CBS 7841 TaxID=1295531 RepID=A0A1E3ICM1_9TREE|nr:hypothetical protein L203_04303 [Cryptococcus depauperatus CBS 7841]